jgi:hypothetical protein
MDINLTNEKTLCLDKNKWKFSQNTKCSIIAKDDEFYEIQNKNGIIAKIPKSIIYDNNYEIIDNEVTLSEALYNHWILNPYIKKSNEKFNELFSRNSDLIFKYKEVVLTKAEYYLLRPNELHSVAGWGKSISYSLGALIESMLSGNHYYIEEFETYQKMYLISIKRNPINGIVRSEYWCSDQNTIVTFSSQKNKKMPSDWINEFSFIEKMPKGSSVYVGLKDRAVEQLINELLEKEKEKAI